MKKLAVVISGLLVLTGCSSVEPETVSYPVQTEENVQSSEQPEDISVPEESPSVIENEPAPETESVDAPIVEEEDVQKDVQVSEPEVTPEPVVTDAPIVEEIVSTHENRWIKKCRDFDYSSSNEWIEVYLVIIQDVCSTRRVDSSLVNIVYGPSVDATSPSVQKYVDTILFSYTYWSRYMTKLEKPYWVVLTPEDKDWWATEHDKYTPLTHNLSCPYYSENNFCSQKYLANEGRTSVPGNVHLFVLNQTASLRIDTYIDPAHNAVHWYQKEYGYEHWYELLIEGHATLYEIAFYMLEVGGGTSRAVERHREEFAWMSHTRDQIKFTATTTEGVINHFESCRGVGGGCIHFYYGGGAMFHEKLILDFGYASYLDWHARIDAITEKPPMVSQFRNLFQSYFGVGLSEYYDRETAPYILDSFNYYYNLW